MGVSKRRIQMNSQHTFSLEINEFQKSLSTFVEDLWNDRDFSDVTLVCGDAIIEAHKVILSALSPLFKQILKHNKHPNPLIYMSGTNPIDLAAVVDFVYKGEDNIQPKNLDGVLALAKELQINSFDGEEQMVGFRSHTQFLGKQSDSIQKQEITETRSDEPKEEQLLCGSNESKGNTENRFKHVDEAEDNFYESITKETFDNASRKIEAQTSPLIKTFENKSGRIDTLEDTAIKIEKLDKTSRQEETMAETSMQIEALIDKAEGSWICKVCPFNSKAKDKVKDHVQTHMNLEFPCILCGKIVRTSTALRMHKKKCEIKTKIEGSDKTSRQLETLDETSMQIEALIAKAEGSWICKVCPFNSKAKGAKFKVKDHVQTHMNLEFTCILCGKIVRTSVALRLHKKKCEVSLKSK